MTDTETTFDAVRFQLEGEAWRAVANGKLQKPDFNSKGAALIFAKAVAEGKRKEENVDLDNSEINHANFSSIS